MLELLETVKETGGTGHHRKARRLARDLMVNDSVLADFERKGVTVISVAEPDLCSGAPTSGSLLYSLVLACRIDPEILHLRHDIGGKGRHSRRPRRSSVPARLGSSHEIFLPLTVHAQENP
jgi:hypothetical protein